MALKLIGSSELEGKGVAGLPDVPGLPAQAMKQKFEEVVRDVVIPTVNDNAKNTYDKTEVEGKIATAVLLAGAADMTRAVYDPRGKAADGFAAKNVDLAGYQKPAATAAVTATDNVAAAIGKLEAGLDGCVKGSGDFITKADGMEKAVYAPDATAAVTDGKLVITSTYPHAQTTYTVQFIAPAGYDEDMPVVVDGMSMQDGILGMNMQPLQSGAFAMGAPVTLVRSGSKAFMQGMKAASPYFYEGGLWHKGYDWYIQTGVVTCTQQTDHFELRAGSTTNYGALMTLNEPVNLNKASAIEIDMEVLGCSYTGASFSLAVTAAKATAVSATVPARIANLAIPSAAAAARKTYTLDVSHLTGYGYPIIFMGGNFNVFNWRVVR